MRRRARDKQKKPLGCLPNHPSGPLNDTVFATSGIVQGIIYEKASLEQPPGAPIACPHRAVAKPMDSAIEIAPLSGVSAMRFFGYCTMSRKLSGNGEQVRQ